MKLIKQAYLISYTIKRDNLLDGQLSGGWKLMPIFATISARIIVVF